MKIKQLKKLKLLIACSIFLPSLSNAQYCEPEIVATTPTERFTENNDGTVTDTKTGLMWQKCIDGQSGVNCATGPYQTYNWQGALQRVAIINSTTGFATYVDWRLPNVKELYSITEKKCFEPAINLEVFPTTGDRDYTWTSTPDISDPTRANLISFQGGDHSGYLKTETHFIRLVRDSTSGEL